MMIHIPLFLCQSRSLWRTCCNTTETTCAAAARKYVSKILCKSQRVLHIPKCSTTRALDLCYHVVSMSNNIFTMDVANILHAEDRFFSALHKILCNQTMFGNKTLLVVQCLIAVKQQYLK